MTDTLNSIAAWFESIPAWILWAVIIGGGWYSSRDTKTVAILEDRIYDLESRLNEIIDDDLHE